MELDELKQELKEIMATDTRSASNIAAMLTRKTASLVYQLRRSLQFELCLAILFIVGCGTGILFGTEWSYRTFFSIFIFAGFAFALVLWALIRKTDELSHSNSVKQNIISIVTVFKTYVKRYLQLGTLLIPVCFLLAFGLGFYDPTKVSKPFRWDIFGYLLLFAGLAGSGIYLFSKWYLRKQYGRYIQQLEETIRELED